MTDPQSPQTPMTPGSFFLKRFYARAALAYLLMAPLLALFAWMTPMTCAVPGCDQNYAQILWYWTVIGAVVSFTIGVLALRKRETNPRPLTLTLMMFPFVFWLIYWLIGKAGGIM